MVTEHTGRIQRNLMIESQENTQIDVRRQGLTDPISWDPSSYCLGLASKTALNWHLIVKDMEYNVDLTKNYCITVTMQKISSIHKLIW